MGLNLKAFVLNLTGGGSGLTSVGLSGGTTGIGVSGSPLIANGTMTLTVPSAISSASTVVARDANQNAFANSFTSKATNVVSAAGTTTLTAASARWQNLTGTLAQIFVLPDATTLSIGAIFQFNNNSTGVLTVKDGGGTTLFTIPSGGQGYAVLLVGVVAAGVWDFHFTLPSNVQWGTTGLPLANLANQADQTILGNITGSPAPPVALTPAQVATMLGIVLNNMNATVDPTINDDSGAGYSVGTTSSLWFNTTTNRLFICTDSTVGAAVWGIANQLVSFSQSVTAPEAYTLFSSPFDITDLPSLPSGFVWNIVSMITKYEFVSVDYNFAKITIIARTANPALDQIRHSTMTFVGASFISGSSGSATGRLIDTRNMQISANADDGINLGDGIITVKGLAQIIAL